MLVAMEEEVYTTESPCQNCPNLESALNEYQNELEIKNNECKELEDKILILSTTIQDLKNDIVRIQSEFDAKVQNTVFFKTYFFS
jgi:predicted  nucleic acid-binding Zn-ribbon protein